MIEHKHWQRTSKQGVQNQHIAVVGYSHYGDPREDSPGFTNWALKKFISGALIGNQFFPPIQSYFGYTGQADFWNRVHFFNYIPQCFSGDNIFALADSKVVKLAQIRFLRILTKEKPEKVFVFSRKGWDQCPHTVEEQNGGRCNPLKSNPKDNWGTYNCDGHQVRVCGFRHPLYANHDQVRRSVQEFLSMP
jgi:hypothetical protein